MKPIQFDLKLNPETLVTRAEEHLHFLRERNTYFENAKVEGVSVPVPVLRYKIFDGARGRVFDAAGRCEQGVSGKYEPELYPWR